MGWNLQHALAQIGERAAFIEGVSQDAVPPDTGSLRDDLIAIGDTVCARAFQSAVACADVSRGALLWSRNVGGIRAIGGDAERVVGADASDRIGAWRTDNGDVAWTSEKLLYRGLSGAAVVGPVVAFGDSEGYVHFLSLATGEPQLRLRTDDTPVIGTPVLSGATLLVMTQGGGLYAFRPN